MSCPVSNNPPTTFSFFEPSLDTPPTTSDQPARSLTSFSKSHSRNAVSLNTPTPPFPLLVRAPNAPSNESGPFPYLLVSPPSPEMRFMDNAAPDPFFPLPRFCTFNKRLNRNRHEEVSPRIFSPLTPASFVNRQKRKAFLLSPLNLPPHHLQLDRN